MEYTQKGLQLIFEDFRPTRITENPIRIDYENISKYEFLFLDLKTNLLYKKAQQDNTNRLALLQAAKATGILAIEIEKRFLINTKGFSINTMNDVDMVKIQYEIYEETKRNETKIWRKFLII